jgi:hypothetical protein
MAYNPYIPWNDEMVVVLLNLVITEGVHLAHKNDITKKWNKVNDLFFEQNELLPYKSAYKKDDHRKIRDKYKSELKKTKADIDIGNQSGKSGELSQKYQLVQHILTEMDSEEEEERKEKKKDKEVLNTIEGQTLNGNHPNPLKKRDLDVGNIVDSSDPTKKVKINPFESAMMSFLAGHDGTTKKRGTDADDYVEDVTKNYACSKCI